MTSLQSIVSRQQKAQTAAAAPANPVKTEVRRADTQTRAEWLRSLFPSESMDTLCSFAMGFESEAEMQTKALALKRENRDLRPEVAGWSYVESKHQSLKSKSKKPVEARGPTEEVKKVAPLQPPQPQQSPPPRPQTTHFTERRGHRGYRRGFQGRGGYRRYSPKNFRQDSQVVVVGSISTSTAEERKAEETAETVQKEEERAPANPPAAEPQKQAEEPVQPPAKTPAPVSEAPQQAAKPYQKPRPNATGGRKWVKKAQPAASDPKPSEAPATISHSFTPLVKPEDPGMMLKEAEAKAAKMTLDLVDHSDESSEVEMHRKTVSTQTEERRGEQETQTEEELIWRHGIPCMLVPLSGVPGYTMQLGVLGNPGKLFGS